MSLRYLLSIAFFMLLFSAQVAFGASINITPSGNGSFVIQGSSMDGIGGIDLNVIYDSSSLASPKVDQGSLITGGTLFVANPNFAPSTIKIAILKSTGFSASGSLAVITFASHTGTGSITASASLIDSKGKKAPGGEKTSATDFQTSTTGSTGFIQSSGIPFSQTNNTPTTIGTTGSSSTTTAPASSVSTSLGTVSMPSDTQTMSDPKPADTHGVPAQPTESEATKPVDPPDTEQPVEPADEKPISEPQTPENVKMTSYKGIIEYFRAYKGEKSPAILIALFNKNIAPTIRQEPAIALSDGKTPIKILVKLEGTGNKSPNFALNGAKLVSLRKDDASSIWIIETLPQANIVQASLTILTDSAITEYPLTLAPPVEGISPAEADFVIFLNDNAAPAPKRDLNGDGKHDFLDDYIYTAHYLIKKDATGKTKK